MPVTAAQFRPTIIIFAEESGTTGHEGLRSVRSVYEHFCDLCAGLDPSFWPGLGLIRALTSDKGAVLPLSTTLTPDERYMPRSSRDASILPPITGDNLDTIFHATLARVQHPDVAQSIAAARNVDDVPEVRTQIFIVGSTHSQILSAITQTIRRRLHEMRLYLPVIFFLTDLPSYYTDVGAIPDQQPEWVHALLSNEGEPPQASFCFMYERLSAQHAVYDPDTVHYVVAETLFGLIATAIQATGVMRQTIETSVPIDRADTRIGSFGPSIIRFPRAEVTKYCAARLGDNVLEEWMKDEYERQLIEEESEREHEAALAWADELKERLSDSKPRRGVYAYGQRQQLLPRVQLPPERNQLCPSFAFMQSEPIESFEQGSRVRTSAYEEHLRADANSVGELEEASNEIFQRLDSQTVLRAKSSFEIWGEAAWNGYIEASASYGQWLPKVDEVWQRVGQRQRYETAATVDRLWLSQTDGINQARTFVLHLENTLSDLSKKFRDLRLNHWAQYSQEVGRLRALAESPRWPYQDDDETIADDPTVQPSAIHPDIPDPIATRPALESRSSPLVLTALTRLERHVAGGLSARVEWMEQHQLTWPGILGTMIFATLAFMLLLIAWFPAALTAQPLLLLGGIGGVMASIGIIGERMRRATIKRRDDARQDLLDAYVLFPAYRCAVREDQLRIATVLGPLIRDVRCMRERLGDHHAFINPIRTGTTADAKRAKTDLFDGPAMVRDVFVGNGREIVRYKHHPTDYTIEDLFQEIDRRRRNTQEPKHAWHRSYPQISEQLRMILANRRQAIILMDPDELRTEIRAFLYGVINPYLTSDLVDIGFALSRPDGLGTQLWQSALKKATLLFRPLSTTPPHLLYAGRREDCDHVDSRVIPTHATVVYSYHPEWMYLGQLCQGGGGTLWGITRSNGATVGASVLFQRPSMPIGKG